MKMKTHGKKITVAVLATLGLGAGNALADSQSVGNAPASAAASVDFRVVIPQVLYFRLGSAATIDELTFTTTTANVGTAVAIAPTGGDVANGVSVEVRSNRGQVTLTPTNNVPLGLTNGTPADGYIDLATITVSTSSANIPAPTLSNAGGTTSQPVLNGGKVTQRTANWTFSYANATLPSAGDYTGRVTFTATTP